ncbi:MAG: hypothetical protein IAE78_21570 [Myxococcus sp.]|nr:hypothetical protein [Myxococcus sp.]
MKRLMMAAAVVAGLSMLGCGVDKGEPFREGFPQQETVKLNLPENKTALTGEGQRRDGLEGQIAEFYKLTRGVTTQVNGAGAAVLTLVQKIAEHRPTSVTQNVAVWGPHTDALSPNTFKFTVTMTAQNEFTYLLEAKGKTEADSRYRAILSGSHVSTGHKLGSGTFLIDFDKAKELPENDGNVGAATYVYSKLTATADVAIDATFQRVRDGETGGLVDVNYGYREQPGNGGEFKFRMNKNWVSGPGIEVLTVKSRWQQSGAGRSDARATGGDLPGVATASECWDSGFASRYLNASFDPGLNYGQESSCAFPTAEYAP